MPTDSIVDRRFAGVALRLAVDRAATFVFAAFVFVRLGITRFDAFAFFAPRLAAFGAVVFRLTAFFAITGIL